MSNEARVSISLNIVRGKLSYRSSPTYYTADIGATIAPTPGGITVPTTGVNVDFSQLDRLGLLWMQNLDDSNSVRWGIHDGTLFHPLGVMLPGEIVHFRLDPDMGEEEEETGTGTTSPVNSFYLKAVGGTCEVRVDAFNE